MLETSLNANTLYLNPKGFVTPVISCMLSLKTPPGSGANTPTSVQRFLGYVMGYN